ncbi:MAG: DUF3352 domain-containing protein [Chloroflexi bacterium]|nr:MAG: DUF3352 domain-containing protein [Chloroflexota bacterium]
MLLRHPGDEPRRRADATATRSNAWGLAAAGRDVRRLSGSGACRFRPLTGTTPLLVFSLPDRRNFGGRRRGGGRRGSRGRPAAVATELHHREDGPGNARRPGHCQPQSIARPEGQSVAGGAQFPRHDDGRRHLEEARRGLQGHRPVIHKRRADLLRSGTVGKKYRWRDETYNGITIASGTPTATSEKPVAYSYVDHVVVVASSATVIHEIIDSDQGRGARLVDSSDFKATMTLLPSDRVGMGYLAGKSLVAGVKQQMAKPSTLGLPALKTVDDLNALQGIGGALSATGNGIAFDLAVKLDASKLSPATRQAFTATGHPDTVLRWVPKTSDGFLAIANVDKSIKSLLDQYGTDPSLKAGTDAVGLTGPTGILPHLTGELGLEIELGNNTIPSGAILLGTNDTAAMNAFLGKVVGMASALGVGSSQGGILSPGFDPHSIDTLQTSTYRGTTITTWHTPSLPGFAPSYAALDRMGVLASSPAEVRAVIDAHLSGSTITTDPTYQAASAASLPRPAGIMYVNLARVVSVIQKLPTSSAVDTKAVAYLAPLQALMLTASSETGAALERFFVAIK